jgi:hypothetical protein
MLKNVSQLEHTISGKVYRFTCENDAELSQVKEALIRFLSYVTQLSDAIEEQIKVDKEKQAQENNQESHDIEKVENL